MRWRCSRGNAAQNADGAGQRVQIDTLLQLENAGARACASFWACWRSRGVAPRSLCTGGQRDKAQLSLHASPLSISGVLADRLLPNVTSAVFTSATLQTGGSFEYFRKHVGLSPTRPWSYLFPRLLTTRGSAYSISLGIFPSRWKLNVSNNVI